MTSEADRAQRDHRDDDVADAAPNCEAVREFLVSIQMERNGTLQSGCDGT